MLYPLLAEKKYLRQTVSAFGGYDHNPSIPENAFYSMENMSADHYPLLSPRGPRSVYASAEAPGGLIAKDALCWVDGKDFIINRYGVDLGLTEGKKQLVSMGAYVIILPDKKYINTADLSDRGSIEASFTTVEPVAFSLCDEEGVAYVPDYTQSSEPKDPGNLALWMDTAASPGTLKQWYEASAMWVSVASVCVKLRSPGIGKSFERYDGIYLNGLEGTLTDAVSGEPLEDTSQLAKLAGTAVILAKGDNYIVITGILDREVTVREPLTVSREMPETDFIIERENRLWGCRYGLNRQGKVVNEIYASKLGDFKNWNCFMGLSTDSYCASVGSDGPFTGAVNYAGYPLFWKENCVHKVFGDYPENFGIQTTSCRGVQQGSGDSLAIVRELLYYKSRHGVCVYDGAFPVEISDPLGKVSYFRAVAGGHGNKYYISMADEAGQWHLFVWDTAKKLWHREDSLKAAAFCSCQGKLYAIAPEGKILCLTEGTEERVSWMAETGKLGLELAERKYVSRLLLRLSMDIGSRLRVFIQYDSLDGWEHVGTANGQSVRSFLFPVRPRRCDHFRLRLEGEGDVKLYSVTKVIVEGSERT